MTTHSSILAWGIPWTEEPGGLQSMGSQRVRHDWSDLVPAHTHTHTRTHSLTRLIHTTNHQFSSVAQSYPTLCDPMDCSTSGFPVITNSWSLPKLTCHLTISSSVVPFSSHLQSFPASGSFPVSQFFTSGGQSMEFQLQHQPLKWIFRIFKAKNNSDKNGDNDKEQTLLEPFLCGRHIYNFALKILIPLVKITLWSRHCLPHDDTKAQSSQDIAEITEQVSELDFKTQEVRFSFCA